MRKSKCKQQNDILVILQIIVYIILKLHFRFAMKKGQWWVQAGCKSIWIYFLSHKAKPIQNVRAWVTARATFVQHFLTGIDQFTALFWRQMSSSLQRFRLCSKPEVNTHFKATEKEMFCAKLILQIGFGIGPQHREPIMLFDKHTRAIESDDWPLDCCYLRANSIKKRFDPYEECNATNKLASKKTSNKVRKETHDALNKYTSKHGKKQARVLTWPQVNK